MRTDPKPARRIDRWRKTRRAVARKRGRGDLPGQLLFLRYVGPLPTEETRTAGPQTVGRVPSLRRKGASK
jgi:hypothetical protein